MKYRNYIQRTFTTIYMQEKNDLAWRGKSEGQSEGEKSGSFPAEIAASFL